MQLWYDMPLAQFNFVYILIEEVGLMKFRKRLMKGYIELAELSWSADLHQNPLFREINKLWRSYYIQLSVSAALKLILEFYISNVYSYMSVVTENIQQQQKQLYGKHWPCKCQRTEQMHLNEHK